MIDFRAQKGGYMLILLRFFLALFLVYGDVREAGVRNLRVESNPSRPACVGGMWKASDDGGRAYDAGVCLS